MKKFILLFIAGLTSLYAAKLPEHEIRPNVSGVHFDSGYGINHGYTYGFDFANKINEKSMLNISLKRGTFDYENDLGSTFINIFGVNGEYYFYEKDNIQSYITAGISYFDINNKIGTVDDMTGFNYGLGLKYLINEDAGLFGEVKHHTTFKSDENQYVYTFGVLIPFGYEQAAEPQSPVLVQEAPVVEEPKEEFVFLDDDKDGVINELDKCPNTDLRYEVDEEGCKIYYTLLVNFEFDSAILTDDSYPIIEKFALFMDESKKIKVEVQGHTDSRGSDQYNQSLSDRRAKSVYDALLEKGVDKNRVKHAGYGESRLLVQEDGTEVTYSQNRRVEAVVLKDK
ncbi:MAG: OmpA family protein [Campylobacterota bacterium]|nr:OmpA family protein [Campylobacterota bacterium]